MGINGKYFTIKIIFKNSTCIRFDNVVDIVILDNKIEITYFLINQCTLEKEMFIVSTAKRRIKNLEIEWSE